MTRQEALLRLLQKQSHHPALLQFDFESDSEAFSPELDRARLNLKQGSYEIAYNQLKELQSQELLADQHNHIQAPRAMNLLELNILKLYIILSNALCCENFF